MIRFGYSEIRTGWGLCGGAATRVSNFPVYYSLKAGLIKPFLQPQLAVYFLSLFMMISWSLVTRFRNPENFLTLKQLLKAVALKLFQIKSYLRQAIQSSLASYLYYHRRKACEIGFLMLFLPSKWFQISFLPKLPSISSCWFLSSLKRKSFSSALLRIREISTLISV